MLDESFKKMDSERLFPKDENEKFKFRNVFTPEVLSNQTKLQEVLDTIWPNWNEYIQDEVDRSEPLEVNGQQTDVDDWDVYEIRVEYCYGGIEEVIQTVLDNLDDFDKNKVLSLKEILDLSLQMAFDNALDNVSSETLREYGRLIWSGRRRSYR